MPISESSFKELPSKKINIKPVQSIAEYEEYMCFILRKFQKEELWYRGVLNYEYPLTPSIYRETTWNYNSANEKDITHSFIHRAKGYIQDSSSIGKWEWYQIMQHHGLPTRLLDWTEGYLIALYFAVRNIIIKSIPAVWIIRPIQLNYFVTKLAAIYYTDPITRDDEDKIVDNYLPGSNDLPELPIALLPPYVNERMSAQKSCFTIHGKSRLGFEIINDKFQLIQLTIDPLKVEEIRMELFKMGITDATLFPDLEGLARELRYKFGMKI